VEEKAACDEKRQRVKRKTRVYKVVHIFMFVAIAILGLCL